MGNKLKKFKEKHPEYSSAGVKDSIIQLKAELSGSTLGVTQANMKKQLALLGSQNKQQEEVWKRKMDGAAQVCGLQPEEYGLYDYTKIDYKNPIVELEYFLSHPNHRHKVSQTQPLEEREQYLNANLSPEAVELYWHPETGAKWDKSGTPYEPPTIPYYDLTFDKAEVVGDAREALGLKREGIIQRVRNKKSDY